MIPPVVVLDILAAIGAVTLAFVVWWLACRWAPSDAERGYWEARARVSAALDKETRT